MEKKEEELARLQLKTKENNWYGNNLKHSVQGPEDLKLSCLKTRLGFIEKKKNQLERDDIRGHENDIPPKTVAIYQLRVFHFGAISPEIFKLPRYILTQ